MKKKIIKRIVAFTVSYLCAVSMNAQVYNYLSYHIYTNDDDKYLTTNVHNDSSKVIIDKVNQKIELSLYNPEVKKWMPFSLKVNYKIDLGFKSKIGTLYMCTNNANQTCGVCIINTKEGFFIDFHDFYVGEKNISCWVKSGKE